MKASKDKKSKDSTNDTSIPKKTLPKEFKWGGFKSHMMATMAKWREVNYLTDATFQCVSLSHFMNFMYGNHKDCQKFWNNHVPK